ncbi:unnamed protein product [Camellia sinensis]
MLSSGHSVTSLALIFSWGKVKQKNRRNSDRNLKDADLKEATELKVRTMATERLGIDLSHLDHKWFVRRVEGNRLVQKAKINQLMMRNKSILILVRICHTHHSDQFTGNQEYKEITNLKQTTLIGF